MWFKYGLKAQKLLAQGIARKQHALKGQQLYILPEVLKLFPLQGDNFANIIAQGDALG
uniref:hypothetical protein n=1 Tax=Prevotella sp. TaxID=59823 RepID=UPI004028B555